VAPPLVPHSRRRGLSQRGVARVVGVRRDRVGLDSDFRALFFALLLVAAADALGAFAAGPPAFSYVFRLGGRAKSSTNRGRPPLTMSPSLEGRCVRYSLLRRTYGRPPDGLDPRL